uniref:TM2 domain-containing protein n=1 Tax=Soboliphyme baturini TaxID=241478 RepID=A0A183IJ47_9BILA
LERRQCSSPEFWRIFLCFSKSSFDNFFLRKLCSAVEKCSDLGASCLDCEFPANCKYGESLRLVCRPKTNGDRHIERNGECTFCYLKDATFHRCRPIYNCSPTAPSFQRMIKTLCVVDESFVCLGRRTFYKVVPCNWTRGYKWWKALVLSITLGGFGVDRFYLGLWRSGIGKLFSFGGIGVWTVVDVILIATGYVGPADGSLYM